MAIKTKDGQFRCMYCERIHEKEEKADECRETHDIKYLPISKEDLNKLANYILHPNPKLIMDVYGKPIPVVRFILQMLPGNRSLR
ncbi:MAG TPA: hypothetical protein ENI23_01790 [bacterium]|nr:hypothetical protein [bacterium]